MDPIKRRPVSANTAPGESSSSGAPPPSPRRNNATPARAPLVSNNSSIRIRRLTSSSGRTVETGASDAASIGDHSATDDAAVTNRRRSLSAPQRPTHLVVPGADMSRQTTNTSHQHGMPSIQERQNSGNLPLSPVQDTTAAPARPRGLSDLHAAGSGMQATFSAANAARANRGLSRMRSGTVRSRPPTSSDNEYNENVLGLLDLVDPEVQTLGTLTNLQNSLFVPDLGRLINRRPTYNLTSRPSGISRSRAGTLRDRAGTVSTIDKPPTIEEPPHDSGTAARRTSISSQLTESHWAVLPHGESLEGWTDEDIAELNDHVRHLLHSRKEGFRRSWRGFKKYISKPLGLFVFVYAVLVTLFGAAWVFFLIGWVYVGERQQYAVDVIDNVLVALFALMGDGLAPFRAVDTYHMYFIAHFHHLTWRLRKERDMPKLANQNDLPSRRLSAAEDDLEPGENVDDVVDRAEFSVLSLVQQRRLQYHQAKFSKSHTFYRPHETATHHAFPVRLLVAIVVLLDCHSLFQIALGTCTWSIDYTVRPEALTATILSCSITCNIVAGVLVSIGDKRTRKKEVLDKIFRQNLTKEAIETLEQRRFEHDKNNDADRDPGSHDDKNSKLPKFSLDLYRNHPPADVIKAIPRKSLDLHRNHGPSAEEAKAAKEAARRSPEPPLPRKSLEASRAAAAAVVEEPEPSPSS